MRQTEFGRRLSGPQPPQKPADMGAKLANCLTLPHNVGVKMNSSTDATRILVIMPNWLGDGVMATPLLRELFTLSTKPAITALARPLVAPVLEGMPYVQRIIPYQYRKNKIDMRATARALAGEHFDAAIILPNNWRSALIAWRAGIPVRLGYGRDGRRWILTHSIQAALRTDDEIDLQRQRERFRRHIACGSAPNPSEKKARRPGPLGVISRPIARWHNYQPVSTIEYYLKLMDLLPTPWISGGRNSVPPVSGATALGPEGRLRMEVFCSGEETATAEQWLCEHHVMAPYAVVFPGANFGASKCWPPERFAELVSWLANGGANRDWHILLAGAPSEKPMLAEVMGRLSAAEKLRVINLAAQEKPATLGTVKALVARAGLVVCNDTGPRHFAAAFARPLVTLFGPTDPRWAQTYDPCEQIVSVPVECGPCQLKVCPIDHRCMQGITVAMVKAAVVRAIEARKE